MNALKPSAPLNEDLIELVCPNGHRTLHSRARILRVNDGWCGKCGADISYDPSADAVPGQVQAPVKLVSSQEEVLEEQPSSSLSDLSPAAKGNRRV